jgi:hypothetical protein
MPHSGARPKSFWWYRSETRPPYDDTPTNDSLAVIDLYLHQCSRGRTLPADFRGHLLKWLQDLNRPVKISPRRERFWTIPAYELAHKINPKTLCKRIRELEKIAIRLFPGRAPSARNRPPLTGEEKQEIRKLYHESMDADAAHRIAAQFQITPARVGQICRDIRAWKTALREAMRGADEAGKPSEVVNALPDDTF